MDVSIEPIAPWHAPRARTVIARAFADDPLMTWLFPTDDWTVERRLDAIAMLYWPSVETYCAAGSGHVALVGEQIVGVALWSVPNSFRTPDALPLASTVASLLIGEKQRQLASAMKAARDMGKPPATPYLHDLAVAKDRQNEGIGSRLLREGLKSYGSEGAWLETTNSRNHAVYERAGFDIISEWPIGDTGVRMTRMERS